MNKDILYQLNVLYERLDDTRELTAYTANEGRRAAKEAIRLIESWQPNGEEGANVKSAAVSSIKRAADLGSTTNDPWYALTKTQDAIELFIHEVGGSF